MIFSEKVSGVATERKALAKLLRTLQHGDIIVVCKLDRLGRSTKELLVLLDQIKDAGAAFKSLGDPMWDTSSPQGKLLATMLAAVAELERSMIIERTSAGRERARKAGIRFGRPQKLSAFQRQEAARRKAAGEPLSVLAQAYGVSTKTIMRLEP